MEIVRLRPEQLPEASAVLAHAFQNDPAWSWVLPNAARRASLLPWLFRVAFEVTAGDAWTTVGGISGCARWVPPGRAQVHTGAMLRALVTTPLKVREATSRFLAFGRSVEAMRLHAVPEPHWYLAGIGVAPGRRREGIGSSLLAPGLSAADRDELPCALLTNLEENVRFYERHGFVVVSEGATPDGGPHAWMMRRSPGASPIPRVQIAAAV